MADMMRFVALEAKLRAVLQPQLTHPRLQEPGPDSA